MSVREIYKISSVQDYSNMLSHLDFKSFDDKMIVFDCRNSSLFFLEKYEIRFEGKVLVSGNCCCCIENIKLFLDNIVSCFLSHVSEMLGNDKYIEVEIEKNVFRKGSSS